MADRSFHPAQGNLELDVVSIYASFAVAASGVPTLNTAPGSKGVTSVTHNSAGKYTILLQDVYFNTLFIGVQVVDSTNSDPTAVGVASRVFSHSSQAVGGAQVVIQFYETGSATPIDPRNGAVVLVKMDFRNSSVV